MTVGRVFALLAAIVVGIPLLAVGSCVVRVKMDTVRESWHQKMELTIATPDGERRGAAVQAIEWAGFDGETRKTVAVLDGNSTSWNVQAEAVVVEVAPGKYLFALLRSPNGIAGDPGKNLSYALLKSTGTRAYVSTPEAIALIKAQPLDQPIPLPPDAVPLLVTFADITDPTTVTRVDPANLAASFGPGVSLTSVTLAVTEDPVTEGRVEGVLGWLGSYKKNQWRLNGENCVACPVSSDQLADLTDPSDFLVWVDR